MRWSLITDAVGLPGWRQMALDQALLDLAERDGSGWVRLYRWDPWCLSFGRHEPARRRYDRAAIERRGIDTVRRPTGGRAVWHARELTYAVAAPRAWFGTLAVSYRAIHEVLASALRDLGVEATLADPRPALGPGAGACFTSAVGGEVLAGGRKLVGSAQLRQGSAFLQHGSLLLEDDQRLVGDLTLGEALPGRETTLLVAAGRRVTFAEAAEAVTGRVRAWNGDWRIGERDGDLEGLAATAAARFRDPAWTWNR